MSYLSRIAYTGEGTVGPYAVPFPYIDKAHVKVYINGVETTAFTWPTTSTIQFNEIVAIGAIIMIKRISPNDSRMVEFQNASLTNSSDFNLEGDQGFYLTQEALDDASSNAIKPNESLNWEANNKTIQNLATPVNPTDAATKAYVDTGQVDEAIAQVVLATEQAIIATNEAVIAAEQAVIATNKADYAGAKADAAAQSDLASQIALNALLTQGLYDLDGIFYFTEAVPGETWASILVGTGTKTLETDGSIKFSTGETANSISTGDRLIYRPNIVRNGEQNFIFKPGKTTRFRAMIKVSLPDNNAPRVSIGLGEMLEPNVHCAGFVFKKDGMYSWRNANHGGTQELINGDVSFYSDYIYLEFIKTNENITFYIWNPLGTVYQATYTTELPNSVFPFFSCTCRNETAAATAYMKIYSLEVVCG
jgi:hypothetical protein